MKKRCGLLTCFVFLLVLSGCAWVQTNTESDLTRPNDLESHQKAYAIGIGVGIGAIPEPTDVDRWWCQEQTWYMKGIWDSHKIKQSGEIIWYR